MAVDPGFRQFVSAPVFFIIVAITVIKVRIVNTRSRRWTTFYGVRWLALFARRMWIRIFKRGEQLCVGKANDDQ